MLATGVYFFFYMIYCCCWENNTNCLEPFLKLLTSQLFMSQDPPFNTQRTLSPLWLYSVAPNELSIKAWNICICLSLGEKKTLFPLFVGVVTSTHLHAATVATEMKTCGHTHEFLYTHISRAFAQTQLKNKPKKGTRITVRWGRTHSSRCLGDINTHMTIEETFIDCSVMKVSSASPSNAPTFSLFFFFLQHIII